MRREWRRRGGSGDDDDPPYIVNGRVVRNRNNDYRRQHQSTSDCNYNGQQDGLIHGYVRRRSGHRQGGLFVSVLLRNYANWTRIGTITVIVLVLFVSNPANYQHRSNATTYTKKRYYNHILPSTFQQLLHPPPHHHQEDSTWSSYNDDSLTNYGIFSLQKEVVVRFKQQTRLRLFAFGTSLPICNYYHETNTANPTNSILGASTICSSIGNAMIDPNGKYRPFIWDMSDRVYTTNRIIYLLLIASSVFQYCFPTMPPIYVLYGGGGGRGGVFGGGSIARWVIRFLSAFDSTPNTILWDLVRMNTCIYPTLVTMSRIVPKLSSSSTNKSMFQSLLSSQQPNDIQHLTMDWNYVFWTIVVLFIGIGGGCNILTTKLTGGYRCRGLSTTVAASLAYIQRISSSLGGGYSFASPILFHIMGRQQQPVTAVNGYWTILVTTIIYNSNSRQTWPFVVSWLLGGFCGSLLAKYHLENLFVVGNILKFFGMT